MLVSVIMPMYNKSKYVEDAINSILRQTYKDIELIIIDDCSSDDSLKKVKKFDDNRIKLIELEKNRGVSYATNIGIRNCQGEYIVRMDADDISTRDRIEKLIVFALKENADLVGSQFDIISDSTMPEGLYRFMNYSNSIIEQNEIIDNFTVMMPVLQGTYCMRRDIFEDEHYYNTNIFTSEDYEFLGRLLINNKKVCKIAEKLYYYRYVDSSLSNSRNMETTINSIRIKLDFIFEYHKVKLKEKNNIFIWGTKEFARYLYDELKKFKYDIKVRAFTDFDSEKWGEKIKGLPIIPPDDMTKMLNSDDIVLTIWNLDRQNIIKYLEDKGLKRNLNYFVLS